MCEVGSTFCNFDEDGRCLDLVFSYFYLHHAGLAVQRFGGVEDEVANAVVDIMTTIALNGLKRMGVVAYQHVGPCLYQVVGLQSLTGHRF